MMSPTLRTKRPLLVGLSGKLRSGKTHIAKQLCRRYGFAPLSFATALKEDIVEMGFDSEDVYTRKPPHIRKLLQVYGQARRAQDPGYWISRLDASRQALDLFSPGTVHVIDDVRFPNELDYIHDEGGIVLRLERMVPITCPGCDDESETALDGFLFDGLVRVGDGQLDMLEAGVTRALQYHGVL